MSEKQLIDQVPQAPPVAPPRKTPIWKYLCVAILALFVVSRAPSRSQLPLSGPRASNATELDLVEEILATVQNKTISMYTERYYLAGPHLMGQNWALADHTRELFERYGFEAEIEQFDVLRNLPVEVAVDVHGLNATRRLDLEEDVLSEDPTTGAPDRTPVFHGYSANGTATGKIVYANYGRKEDFDNLKARGVNLNGTIALVRYGGLFRGLKVKFAEQAGCSACLIYSDPADDGHYTEANGYKPYPEGPARNPSSVQRGSVQDMGAAPGDPSTPNFPSVPGADRKTPRSIPKIPSIPISAKNGETLLRLLTGLGPQPEEWQGSLKADYSVGPSELKVTVTNHQNYEIVPIYNVIATLKGHNSDEIIIGNHRDAWILGGADPNSGTATMLELARTLGQLSAKGWKPERTIKFASWDGEEYGMVGSTEHGELHQHELMAKAVAYLNVDLAYSGHDFSVSASPMFDELVRFAARRVPSPDHSLSSLYELWEQSSVGATLKAPGSGSDYVVFLDHLGIPSLDVGFEEDGKSPVYHYHSDFDSFYWMRNYGDTTFEYQASVAKFLGILVTQLSSSAVYPLRTAPYAELLQTTIEGYAAAAAPQFNATHNLTNAAQQFADASTAYDAYIAELRSDYAAQPSWWKRAVLKAKIGVVNRKLKYLDRTLLHHKGLDGRSWYKHIVYAPGRYTGYAGQVLPGLAEAIEDGDAKKFAKWSKIVCEKLCELTKKLS